MPYGRHISTHSIVLNAPPKLPGALPVSAGRELAFPTEGGVLLSPAVAVVSTTTAPAVVKIQSPAFAVPFTILIVRPATTDRVVPYSCGRVHAPAAASHGPLFTSAVGFARSTRSPASVW